MHWHTHTTKHTHSCVWHSTALFVSSSFCSAPDSLMHCTQPHGHKATSASPHSAAHTALPHASKRRLPALRQPQRPSRLSSGGRCHSQGHVSLLLCRSRPAADVAQKVEWTASHTRTRCTYCVKGGHDGTRVAELTNLALPDNPLTQQFDAHGPIHNHMHKGTGS